MRRTFLSLLANLAAVCSVGAADFQPDTLPLGASAPDFTLSGVDGRNHTLKDFSDAKILVLVFT